MRAFVELMTISGETFPTTLATIIYDGKKCIGATIGESTPNLPIGISKLDSVGITDILELTT